MCLCHCAVLNVYITYHSKDTILIYVLMCVTLFCTVGDFFHGIPQLRGVCSCGTWTILDTFLYWEARLCRHRQQKQIQSSVSAWHSILVRRRRPCTQVKGPIWKVNHDDFSKFLCLLRHLSLTRKSPGTKSAKLEQNNLSMTKHWKPLKTETVVVNDRVGKSSGNS
jgi:hypothetical protein